MEKYRRAYRYILRLVELHKAHPEHYKGELRILLDWEDQKLEGVKVVARYDMEISSEDFDEILNWKLEVEEDA